MFSFKRMLKAAALTVTAVAAVTALASATELKIGVGYVQANGGLNLRAAATTESEVLATAPNGEVAVVIGQVGNFYLVDYDLKIGYMSADYLQFKAVETVDLGVGRVNCPLVNIRTAPSTSGNLVSQLTQGYEVNIIGLNQGWYKVTFEDKAGYIRSDLLELASLPPMNSGYTPYATTAAVNPIGEQIAKYATNFIGVPYVWGGTTASGFDCSGFTQYVMRQYGYTINRVAAAQLENGTSVAYNDLAAGDLVFFANTYYSNEAATHVGIYMGDGNFIHAANGGVKITSLSENYYASRYVGARRIA